MRSPLDTSTLVLAGVAVDGGALRLAGLMQVGLLLAPLAGVVTPGWPMVPSLVFPVFAGWLVSVFNHE
ncbi:MAG: hypothetical protein DMD87_27720 [Candidatus Rokuibacteriota bacterium]|nr:MAG: hypothetical protein DMD87_27720 [Candidatus Rokubacteria bacterium]